MSLNHISNCSQLGSRNLWLQVVQSFSYRDWHSSLCIIVIYFLFCLFPSSLVLFTSFYLFLPLNSFRIFGNDVLSLAY